MAYEEKQIEVFLNLAQEVGIGRAMRELGYPKSFSTGQYWAEKRGVSVNVDPIMQHVKAFDSLYETEDMLAVVTQGVNRVMETLVEENDLTPDDQKKLSEAFQKYANTYQVLQGKANNISETRNSDSIDVELLRLVEEQKKLNKDGVESVES